MFNFPVGQYLLFDESERYQVLDKAGKAKDLERYVVVAINSEK